MTIQQFIPQSNILPSANFASFPAASGFPVGWRYRALDVGTHGSTWVSDGTAWQLDGGVVNLFQNTIPMAIPPSGVITVGTGALTLGTALDNIYPSIYMWFPAGAWTGSTAGMYYVAMTSTTVGTVYSNQYTGGVATIPSSPTIVTTGVGAYVQTISTGVTVLTYAMAGGVMGATGKITSAYAASTSTSSSGGTALAKQIYPLMFNGVTSVSALNNGTANLLYGSTSRQNVGLQTSQIEAGNAGYFGQGNTGAINKTSVNTGVAVTLGFALQLAAATDWIILQSYSLQLSRQTEELR